MVVSFVETAVDEAAIEAEMGLVVVLVDDATDDGICQVVDVSRSPHLSVETRSHSRSLVVFECSWLRATAVLFEDSVSHDKRVV